MDIAIRPATPRDRRGVFAAIRTVWGGNDYLLRTFDEWVLQRRDRLYVAELDGRIVGVARLAWFSPRDAWLETLRVHPRFRHRGIGRELMRHRIAIAEAAGARRVAFSTESHNESQIRSARRLGFRRLTTLRWMVARARAGEAPRRAQPGDEASLWRLVRERAATAAVLVHRDRGWRWQHLERSDISAAIRAKRCFVSVGPRGVRAFAIVDPDKTNGELIARVLVGDARGVGELLEHLRAVARVRGLARVSAFRPEGRLEATFRTAGYRAPWRFSAAYYERSLRG